jgi:dihydroorotate dehydrogenase electron transfer subunit
VDDIGPGTLRLARLAAGEDAWLVGPLGTGFSVPRDVAGAGPTGALLVGGGIGIAPLVGWAEALRRDGVTTRTLLGFRSASLAGAAHLMDGDVDIATDDGSAGRSGLVTELLEEELRQRPDQVVYACGPPQMLEAVRRIADSLAVPAELALEEAMACGFGACFGCVVRTTAGYRRLCVDGPVIRASDLDDSWIA